MYKYPNNLFKLRHFKKSQGGAMPHDLFNLKLYEILPCFLKSARPIYKQHHQRATR